MTGRIDGPMFSVVVPLCNEVEVLPELHRRLGQVFERLGGDVEFLFVDDGSSDGTSELLTRLDATDDRVRVLSFSRNFGHQAAVTAGLHHARGQAVIVMDGDLQDPPEVLPELIERWREGYDVVLAIRTKRKEGALLRFGYFAFYRLLRGIADLEMPLDTGDFCLMDRKAVDQLNRLPESVRFVRGLRAYLGFKQIGVPYERDPRAGGQAKYTFGKLVGLAFEGIVNFSGFPIRVIGWLALLLQVLAGATSMAVLLAIPANSTSFWPLLLGSLLVALAGLQLGAIGLVGHYLLRVFSEVKRRPSYILDEAQPAPQRRSATRHPALAER